MSCPNCGCAYVATGDARCPNCTHKGVVKSEDEITKKIIDDSDLIKGG